MKFHPLTHIIIAIEWAIMVIMLPIQPGSIFLTVGFIMAVMVSTRTHINLTGTMVKILAVAALFLVIMHGISWKPFSLSKPGLFTGLDSLIHIAIPATCILYLTKEINSEEFYSFLIDIKTPPIVIFILFRTIWLVPRLNERIEEVVVAQKLRGMKINTLTDRIRAIIPTLSPIFASMFNEVSENSLTLTTRGFLTPGTKTHITTLKYGKKDIIITFIATCITILAARWF